MKVLEDCVRGVLTEMEQFLDSLKSEKLSKKIAANKDKVIELLKKLREDFPQLQNTRQPEATPPAVTSDRDVSDGSIRTGSSADDEDAYSENVPYVSAKDLANPTKSGYLEKKRKKPTLLQKSFQKRYCVIQDNIFYYYENSKDAKQSGAFSLEGYEFREAPHLIKENARRELCFELVSPGKRSYQFLAPSAEEFQAWKELIGGSGTSSTDIIVEGEMEDIYEDVEDVTEKARKLAANEDQESSPTDPHFDDGPEETYDDAETIQNAMKQFEDEQEVYVDVDNVDKTKLDPTPPPVPPPLSKPSSGPPPVPPSINKPTPGLPSTRKTKPKMELPEIPQPSKQEMPLPSIPVASDESVEEKPKLHLTVNPDEDYDNMYYGKWDCTADSDTELSFKHGDIIHIINKDFDSKDWWVGRIDDRFGLVPKKYLIRAYKAAG